MFVLSIWLILETWILKLYTDAHKDIRPVAVVCHARDCFVMRRLEGLVGIQHLGGLGGKRESTQSLGGLSPVDWFPRNQTSP